jgi:hypothetical protein
MLAACPHGPPAVTAPRAVTAAGEASEDSVTQLGSPATESGPDDGSRRPEVGGSRLNRRRVLLGVGIGAALLAAGCVGSSPVAARAGSSRAAAGCGGSSPIAARAGSSSALAASKQLVPHYQPSQATGWAAPYSPTVGGHEPCVQVSYGHKTYRISLLPFGQAASSPNPVYEAVPKDPDVAFEKTLAQEYGRRYTFRYLGGLPSGATFVIESYGVRLYRRAHGLVWDSDLYAIYEPGKSGPAINRNLQFIQVYSTRYPSGGPESRVDASGLAPYYGQGAGLTTINGHQIVNFYDFGPGVLFPVRPYGGVGPQVDRIETFLAKDTGRNAAGKKIVDIYGGIEWGFAFQTVK